MQQSVHQGVPVGRDVQAALSVVPSRRLRLGEHRATIAPWGFDMEVVYEYYEAEPAVLWGDNPYPGAPSYCSIDTVSVGGVEITDMLNDKQHDFIEAALLQEHGE